jgi:hypothetical protein
MLPAWAKWIDPNAVGDFICQQAISPLRFSCRFWMMVCRRGQQMTCNDIANHVKDVLSVCVFVRG